MTEDSREDRIDPFFETVHNGQWHACVGVQGSELNYVGGYASPQWPRQGR